MDTRNQRSADRPGRRIFDRLSTRRSSTGMGGWQLRLWPRWDDGAVAHVRRWTHDGWIRNALFRDRHVDRPAVVRRPARAGGRLAGENRVSPRRTGCAPGGVPALWQARAGRMEGLP